MLYILEGLPGAGKTSIFNKVSKNGDFGIVEQVIPHQFCNDRLEKYYFYSDCLKYKKALLLHKKSDVVMDRGYLSTLAYNYAFDKLFKSKNYTNIKKRFDQKKNMFFKPCTVLYITVDINESLSRKNRAGKNDNIWCDKKFLFYMREFYETKMPKLNKDIITIRINGMETKHQVFNRIRKIINGLK